jgi:hypothetical protein
MTHNGLQIGGRLCWRLFVVIGSFSIVFNLRQNISHGLFAIEVFINDFQYRLFVI